MSGRVPPSSRANLRRVVHSLSSKAALLYEQFTGHKAEKVGSVFVPDLPPVAAVIGPCDAICYSTVRDGELEKYIHEFAAKDRPLLCVSPDGEQLLLIAGNFRFTEKGIVDRSDKVNFPRTRR